MRETLTDAHQAFHDHLDVCDRCAKNPFDLCPVGDALLAAAASQAAHS